MALPMLWHGLEVVILIIIISIIITDSELILVISCDITAVCRTN